MFFFHRDRHYESLSTLDCASENSDNIFSYAKLLLDYGFYQAVHESEDVFDCCLEEFLPHECDLGVFSEHTLEHPLALVAEGVVVDGVGGQHPHPGVDLPAEGAGGLRLHPEVAEATSQ